MDEIQKVSQKNDQIQENLRNAKNLIGIVRYNAFSDSGSDLSFSIAWLNEKADGIVITSLYGREDTRVYAKPVESGGSVYPLTAEEREAIKRAAAASSV